MVNYEENIQNRKIATHCQSCGAPRNPNKSICEYCGTPFFDSESENLDLLNAELLEAKLRASQAAQTAYILQQIKPFKF